MHKIHLSLLLVISIFSAPGFAALVAEEITSTSPLTYKGVQYEAISGNFTYEFDPTLPTNAAIVDLNLAEKNDQGKVVATANFFIIQQTDPAKRTGALLEVSNRGSKASLRYFNHAGASNLPNRPSALGDGLIQDLGLSLIWVGWQGDVPQQETVMHAILPRVTGISGMVRSDWTVDKPSSLLSLAHRSNINTIYPIDMANVDKAQLTRRMGRDSLKAVVPKDEWQFAKDGTQIAGNFTPGIYELVYPSADPMVMGIGLGIIRDTAEFIKDKKSAYYAPYTLAFGVSQTGRFLRQFLYQGFNETEMGLKAFDGMFIHTAGAGRGSFNHRFAQPSRDGHRMSAFFYPTDIFPFTSKRSRSIFSRKKDGLLKLNHNDFYPKIFYTNTGYEYWGRAAGLIHTRGVRDVKPLDNERIYHFASTQHFVESVENIKVVDKVNQVYQGNPVDFRLHLRALLTHLQNWVTKDLAPPESAYPRFADRTLTNFGHFQLPNWVNIPVPFKPHTIYNINFGESWAEGIISNQPPTVSNETVPPVPQLDTNGHELGGIQHPLIKAPIATFLPWVLRYDKFASNEIVDFHGAIKKWDQQRITTRYMHKQAYLKHLNKMARKSISQGWMLPRDLNRVNQQGDWLWQWSLAEKLEK